MLQKIKYLTIAVFFITACTRQNNYFTENETNITGIKLDVGCLVGSPYEITYHAPLLLFGDSYENKVLTVYDVKKEQFVRRFLTTGQGPGEVIRPVRLFASPVYNKIYVFQLQVAKINIYEPNDIIENDYVSNPVQIDFNKSLNNGLQEFNTRPLTMKNLGNGYIGLGRFNDGRFRLYDSAGNTVFTGGKYPFRGEEMDSIARFYVYQGSIATGVDGNSFAIGTVYSDNLEFYHIENGTAVLKKKYESYDVKGIFNGSIMRIEDDCIMSYRGAYGGQYCYMLYSGKTYLHDGKRAIGGGRRIIVFDWDGNYIKSYKTDVDVMQFCVDEENNIIYATARDDNDETGGGYGIFKFNM